MNKNIKIIALDLDGTLLTSDKRLSERNAAALRKAADAGIHIVPTTGRYYNNIPEALRSLDFINYAITINGAYVYDIRNDKCIYRAEMPVDLSVEVMEFLDQYPVIYGAYIENAGYITKALQDRAEEFTSGYYAMLLKNAFKPVDELKAFVKEFNHPVQKNQFFMRDLSVKEELGRTIAAKYPQLAVSSSVNQNIEINDMHANKGEALLSLADYLGIKQEETMAFGDGGNDISMVRAAGCGVAMINGRPDLKEIADVIAPHHNDDGVAIVIEEYLNTL